MSDEPLDAPLEMPPGLPPGWREVLDEIHERHIKAHNRLRQDFRGMETSLMKIDGKVESNHAHWDNMYTLTKGRFATIDQMLERPDASKLSLSARPIIAIIGTIVGGALLVAGSGWQLSSKIDALSASQTAQQKLYDLQLAALQDSVKQTSARYELLRMEVQNLKETVIGVKGRQ